MDKNYNVDDILSDIKRRKSMQKGQEADPKRPPRPERPQPERPQPAPAREERAPAEPKETRHPGDFNFVLDEKAVERKWAEEARREKPQGEPAARTSAQPPARTPAPPVPDEPEAVRGERPNPLDYAGHVRPLTDRAKVRGRSYEEFARQRAERRSQQTHRTEAEAASPEAPEAGGSSLEQTRVLPKSLRSTFATGTGRELKLEDIRKIDFGALHKAGVIDSIYDDDDDLADGLPASSVTDFGEYNSVDDRREVARDIAKTKLWLFIRAAATAVLALVVIYLALCGRYEFLPMPPAFFPEPETMRMYMIALTVLTGLVAIVNSAAVGGGIANLFRMRANSDTLVSLALLACMGQGVAGIVNPELVDPAGLNLYFPIAALAMLAGAVAKLSIIGRIQQNFRVIASGSAKKSALLPVENDQLCYELIRESSRRRPTVAFGVRAGFFTDFLALSFSDKYDVGVNRSVAPVCLAGAVAVAFSAYFLTQSMYGAISAFTAILCVCATLSSSFIETIPLSKLAKKLTHEGGMVSGNKAVEDYCDTRAVILNEKDLFPRGHVSLHGIKAFSRGRIDEAILDAASVICALDGALAPLFLDMIGGNKKLLRRVDNIVFENGMGVSAWVDQRRVLIGNRQLMQNHGIALPRDKYEQGLMPAAQGDPIYLSNSGEVSARFLVGYQIDEELAVQLDQLSAQGKRLIVYTMDANITARRLWELYGYPEDLIRILSSEFHGIYRDISAPRDTAVAEIVYDGRPATMIASILACVNARASILSATVVQMIQIILGYGLVAFMAFMGYIGGLTIYELGIYQLFWFAAIFIVQQTRQP